MTLWFVLALMTAAAIFAVLWPLARRVRTAARRQRHRGLSRPARRDRARPRRRPDRRGGSRGRARRGFAPAAGRRRCGRQGAIVAFRPNRLRRVLRLWSRWSLLPVFAGGLLSDTRLAESAGRAVAERRDAPGAAPSIESMVAQVEAHLERNPEDGRGWEVVAPVYMRLGRFDDAVRARAQCACAFSARPPSAKPISARPWSAPPTASSPPTPRPLSSARWRSTQRCEGAVSSSVLPPSRTARPRTPRASGARCWRVRRPNAPYRPMVQQSLARVDPESAPRPARRPRRHRPEDDDMAAAQQLTPEQRNEMIRGMVERLAERLKNDGSDVDGWLRLVRAYMVLGDPDKARAAVADARRALGDDADKRRKLDEVVRSWGWKAERKVLGTDNGWPRAEMTRKQRRLILIGAGLGVLALRRRAGADRAEGLDRVLQFADRCGGERTRSRARASGSAGWCSPARVERRRSRCALRRDRRQDRRSASAIAASCRTCSAKGRAWSPKACSTPRHVQRRHRARQARRNLHAEGSGRRAEEAGPLEGRLRQERRERRESRK